MKDDGAGQLVQRDLTKAQKIELSTRVKEIGGEGSRLLEFTASTETPDRSNDIIDVAGWQTDNWNKNPIFAAFHDYSRLPAGKGVSAAKDLRMKALVIRVYFPTVAELCSDPTHPSDDALFIDTVYNMYKMGVLNAVSVGFQPIKYNPRDDDAVSDMPIWQRGMHFLSQDLLELSAVLVPCNPDALVSARGMKQFNVKGLDIVERAMKVKGAIPYHKYPTAEEDAAWSASTVIGASEVEDLKVICTWYDSDNADVKGSYKLPHHMTKADGYKTVWNGVKAAMGVLFGARNKPSIPADDQEACYNHLVKHYKEFDKDPPEWGKSYKPEELKALFGEEEDVELTEAQYKALEERLIKSLESKGFTVSKAGSKFSKESRETITKATEALDACHKAIKAVHKSLKDMIAEGEPSANSGTEDQDGGSADGREEPAANDHGKSGVVDVVKNLDMATASLKDAVKLFAQSEEA